MWLKAGTIIDNIIVDIMSLREKEQFTLVPFLVSSEILNHCLLHRPHEA